MINICSAVRAFYSRPGQTYWKKCTVHTVSSIAIYAVRNEIKCSGIIELLHTQISSWYYAKIGKSWTNSGSISVSPLHFIYFLSVVEINHKFLALAQQIVRSVRLKLGASGGSIHKFKNKKYLMTLPLSAFQLDLQKIVI